MIILIGHFLEITLATVILFGMIFKMFSIMNKMRNRMSGKTYSMHKQAIIILLLQVSSTIIFVIDLVPNSILLCHLSFYGYLLFESIQNNCFG